jgi:predicted DNA-binding helix-hairpin-helix protein
MSLKVDLNRGENEARFEEDSLDCFIYRSSYKPILKVLLTNCCLKKCDYCINNFNNNCCRYKLNPLTLCKSFLNLYKKGEVRGIFVSNAIYKNADFSQERILETLIILRERLHFPGYIHAKVLPATSFVLIKKLFKYADRLSINLEFPAQKFLSRVSTKILLGDLMKRLKFIVEINREKKIRSGITTQFVVGALEESDREILGLTQYLYRSLGLKRVYYSGFEPVKGTPLEGRSPVNPLRVKRLYEADFLLKDYGFDYRDFLYDGKGNLVLDKSPKVAAAEKNKSLFPVNINKVDYSLLLRIPNIGRKRANDIFKLRKHTYINSFDRLIKIGIPLKAKKWICF